MLFDLEIIPDLQRALENWTDLSSFPGQTLRASITSICCAGWKILGSKEVSCINAWDYAEWDTDVNNDKRLCEDLHKVLRDADCVITHNGKRFDWKYFQSRLMFHGLDPMPKIHHVDTCAESKKNLFVLNNRLQTLARWLTDEEKMKHEGWELWVKTHRRDREAMDKMAAYCKQDVLVLEEIFRRLRPVITSLPNFNLFSPFKEKVCPGCGSSRLDSYGIRTTTTRRYRRYICRDCRRTCNTDIKDEVPR